MSEADLDKAFRNVQEAWELYLKECSIRGQKPQGWGSRTLMEEDYQEIQLWSGVYDRSQQGGMNDRKKYYVNPEVIHRLQRDDHLYSPPATSVLCSKCKGRGRVCPICGEPDHPDHTHKLSSHPSPQRLWNVCPVCVEPFEEEDTEPKIETDKNE